MAIFKTFLHTCGGELMSKWQVRKLKKKFLGQTLLNFVTAAQYEYNSKP